MPARRLSPEERQLWARVAASVKPLTVRAKPKALPEAESVKPGVQNIPWLTETSITHAPQAKPRQVAEPPIGKSPSNTLDSSWDRSLSRGQKSPDLTIDLHGDTLASAHARLNRVLGDGVTHHARLILVITGKPALDNPRLPPSRRGVIRASIQDWIAASPYASNIAAVRNAHPRHGGNGALYIILKRNR